MKRTAEETDIKIDKKVPFPERKYGANSIYPWMKMEAGDSFIFDGPLPNAHAATTYYNAKTGRQFRARTHNGHTRVWRLK